ncbi:N-dimethylarginine dimethylaminohydrolase [Pseudonocardia kunmingensis]|uniref:N-dimethylarginine dimethylaminohydrolase n=2 Tax=Pseudonocardia kunmingensis TaxID=630975 RepID=A0A543D436_9PSEU|nr:N-dimethylarginine dimethylaminohydrolase [Pseudonocardia kunmingensis]
MIVVTSVLPRPSPATARTARPRHYLMCRPDHFEVRYAINPWMHPDVPVDRERALAQWDALRRTYLDLGHRVDLLDPVPGLPDMVYTANGATVVDGLVLGARFRHPERAAEAQAHRAWFAAAGHPVVEPEFVNEGEGDLLVVGDVVLAGCGFRTDPRAHAEAAAVLGREVVALELVDPRYYHLDTAIAVLDETTVAWLPAAFTPAAQEVLRARFPDALVADPADAAVLGLNAVSDGRHVVLPAQAVGLAAALAERGFVPVPVDLSELRKGGGGPKCCTLEVRA